MTFRFLRLELNKIARRINNKTTVRSTFFILQALVKGLSYGHDLAMIRTELLCGFKMEQER